MSQRFRHYVYVFHKMNLHRYCNIIIELGLINLKPIEENCPSLPGNISFLCRNTNPPHYIRCASGICSWPFFHLIFFFSTELFTVATPMAISVFTKSFAELCLQSAASKSICSVVPLPLQIRLPCAKKDPSERD